MVMCIIVGCGNKNGKSSPKKESVVKFSRVPKIVLTEGEVLEEFTTRRRAWISAISRDDLTDDNLENERVYSRHIPGIFLSGQAAKQWDQCTYTCGKGDWFVETSVQCGADYITC